MMNREIIQTRLGSVTGIDRDGVIVFLGLPYAAPPVGGLRWRSPQPAPPWNGTFDATHYPNRCLQPPYPDVIAIPDIPGELSENCLYLNIFTPGADQAKRPVICWIHGGGYLQGSANEYDGSALARGQNCVVVAINYRVNVFGFCDVSALGEDYAGSVSRGFEDQIAALRWIRDNIADYGGDPDCVSIWGESGGAGSVLALQGAPAAEGLFHRSVAFSPGDIDIGASTPPDAAEALAAHLEIESDLEARLHAIPAEELFELYLQGVVTTAQTVDGTVITRPPAAAIAHNGANGPPLITGCTKDEGTYLAIVEGPAPISLEILLAMFLPLINPHSPKDYLAYLDRLMPEAEEVEKMEQVWCDLFRSATLRNAETATDAGAGGWVYNFEPPTNHPFGVTHGSDIAFTFNMFALPASGMLMFHENSEENRAMAERWTAMLVQFARTGDPNGAGLPEWPRYDAASRSCLVFDERPRIVRDPDGDEVRKAYGLS